MAKVSKHRKMKRATVLIKRTQCIKNKKVVQSKSYTPLYQKLKMNNRVLARTLSQEKQEKQFMFTRILELTAEVQDLTNACNSRDHFIANVLNISKDMVQMIVTMSEYLTNTISSCQNFLSNRANKHLTSSSSTGRRESSKRLSTKSPARGVVKPMVSGHTITKPTINLSRVNMQRLPNVNLTIIEEASNTSERSLDHSGEARRSRTASERLRRSSMRNEDNEERVINRVNRRTNRFSSSQFSKRHSNRLSGEGLPNRLSSQNTNRLSIEGHPSRLSKRNPNRLSGERLSSRISKHSSEFSELSKNPRVTLLDVSRYLSNNQSINIKSLTNTACTNNNISVIEDTETAEQSGPETGRSTTIIPETQAYNDSSGDSEHGNNATTRKKSSSNINERNSRSDNELTTSLVDDSEFDPMEGPSWLYSNGLSETSQRHTNSTEGKKSTSSLKTDKSSSTRKTETGDSFNAREHRTWLFDSDSDSESEEVSTLTGIIVQTSSNSRDNRHNSSKKLTTKSYEWPKRAALSEYPKSPLNNMSTEEKKSTINDNGDISRRPDESPVSSLSPDQRRSFLHKSGPSKSFARNQTSRLNLEEDFFHANTSGTNGLNSSNNWSRLPNNEVEEENPMCFVTRHRGGSNRLPPRLYDDDDEDTLLINMNRHMTQETLQPNRDQPEQLQFDVNELLQLTPLKPLLNINKINHLIQPDVEAEHTATVQITQRIPVRIEENSDTFGNQSTIALSRPEIPLSKVVRHEDVTEASASRQNKNISEMTTIKIGSKVELPRLTEMLNTSDDINEQPNQDILTPEQEKQIEVRKRKRTKRVEIKYSVSEDEENEVPVRGKGKPKQRKKETKAKDPSCAKVVLQKLNESHRQSSQSENNVSSTSARSLADQIRQSHDHSSDSDCSSISYTSRPRRNKAPKNLKEPSLHRKLRR